MIPFYMTTEYQVYDTAAQILQKLGGATVGGRQYAEEYRKLDVLTFEERMHIASLIENEILCVGYDNEGEIEIITK